METGKLARLCGPQSRGWRHASRSLRLCPAHAAPTVDDISSLRRALQRRVPHPAVLMPGSVSVLGVCAVDLAREPARHRSVSACAIVQTLPSRFPQCDRPQHLGQCQRGARLADLCRLRTTPDRHRAAPLCERSAGTGPRRDRLCFGFYHHRSLPLGVPLGAVPIHQGRREASYIA